MNYAQLQTALFAWANKAEAEPMIPMFIALAEADMNRRLRSRQMLASVSESVTGETLTLPADFLAISSVNLDGNDGEPAFIDVDGFNAQRQRYAATGRPALYTIQGGVLRFLPALGDAVMVNLAYYASLAPLSDDVTTNWVLEKAPDAYLYGALVQAGDFLVNDPRLPGWVTRYETAMARLETSDLAGSYGALQVRPSACV